MKIYSSNCCARFLVLMFLSIVFASNVHAQLSVSSIFGNGMVLQRDHVIPVWGSAAVSSNVTVSLNGNDVTVQAGSDGKWKAELPAMSAGGPFTMTITSGTQTLTRTDVYIGDVWLASGQSNMEFTVNQLTEAATIRATANDQKIRQFKVPKGLANEPSNELPAGSAWTAATSSAVGNFSAVGYYFAKYLRENINIPVGILNISYGGSRIETWMSDAMLGFDEQTKKLANGEPERQPTVAFNKMIYPILQFPIKGFLWYQGESNADNMEDALAYENLFKTFITGWRNLFGLGDIPFLWVQLPNYGQTYDEPQNWDAWPQLRAGQSSALSLSNTGEAVTIDVGGTDIHPTNKQPVGYRLSLVARKVAYGEDLIYSGPRYKNNLLREDGRVAVNFNYIGHGLKAKNSQTGEVHGFAIAGSDNKLVWANAAIEGEQVLVWNDNVKDPSIIRYAWEYNPANVNLFNVDDLPAAPFLANVNPGFKIATFKAARTAIETGQSTTLTWLVFNASSVTLDGTVVDTSATITITPAQTTTYTLIAVNRENENEKDTSVVTVEVLDPDQINRALNHSVTASTYEACCGENRKPELAVDGDVETRWSSAWQQANGSTQADPNLDDDPEDEWIAVDLGEAIDVERIILSWEAAYASSYNIDVSYDGYLWNTVYEQGNGDGGEDNITFSTSVSGRFIRVHCLKRATQFGYSIFEIAAYGMIATKKPPVVNVESNLGNVVKTGTKVTLTAKATDSDGTIQKAEFYVDGESLSADNTTPFTAEWTPAKTGEYSIAAVVTDNDGLTVQSNPFVVYVNDGTLTKYEAEKATYTGQGTITNSTLTSGGKYMDLKDAWTLTFNDVEVSSAGEYLLVIGYMLNYESPKTQYLVVNGDTISAVEFTAPSKTSWLMKGVKINLIAGTNEISIRGYWNWMSVDYIAVVSTTVSVKDNFVVPTTVALEQNYPNPFNPATNITYTLPNSGRVKLDIFDITGQKITTLIDGVENAGMHVVRFNAKNIASGVYFYRIQFNSTTLTKSMLLLR